jgi:hypothetical protein
MENQISISSSAMLVDLSIGTWTARKLDRKVTDEVNTVKNASAGASRVNKNLLHGVDHLDRIIKYAASVRNWMYSKTLPWSDYGPRLIPTQAFFDFKQELDAHQKEFETMVQNFLHFYPTLISTQAFKLGAMFNRDEYPTVEEIEHKFRFNVSYLPVPTAGDFRVDVGSEAMEELRSQYEAEYARRWEGAVADIRTRLIDNLKHISDRLSSGEEGERKRFRNNILENFAETIATVRQLNITKDEAINALVEQSEKVIANVTIDEVKENDTVRADVRSKVDSILDAFAI